VFGKSKIGFGPTFPKNRIVTMGYCNKRKRTKRRRTKSLTAIKSIANSQPNPDSSEDSLLETFEQSSSNSSFCSTHSHISHNDIDGSSIPGSIFVDDIYPPTLFNRHHSNDAVTGDNQDYQSHSEDIADTGEILDSLDIPLDISSFAEIDDGSADSIDSFSLDNMNSYPNHHSPSPTPSFDEVTLEESASFQIMSLLDSSGCPRICYDRLIALLKKLTKKQGFDVKKAINRETLMKRLSTKYEKHPELQCSVINKQEVFRFDFQHMLQDLVNSNNKHLHQILPHWVEENLPPGTEHELWHTEWMNKTFRMPEYMDFDPNQDIMLPVILYMDKTGTDVNQRYSLEPVLFSLAAIPRGHRESRHSWRHLGFIPQQTNHSEEETISSLQFYHDCMFFLLDGLN